MYRESPGRDFSGTEGKGGGLVFMCPVMFFFVFVFTSFHLNPHHLRRSKAGSETLMRSLTICFSYCRFPNGALDIYTACARVCAPRARARARARTRGAHGFGPALPLQIMPADFYALASAPPLSASGTLVPAECIGLGSFSSVLRFRSRKKPPPPPRRSREDVKRVQEIQVRRRCVRLFLRYRYYCCSLSLFRSFFVTATSVGNDLPKEGSFPVGRHCETQQERNPYSC